MNDMVRQLKRKEKKIAYSEQFLCTENCLSVTNTLHPAKLFLRICINLRNNQNTDIKKKKAKIREYTEEQHICNLLHFLAHLSIFSFFFQYGNSLVPCFHYCSVWCSCNLDFSENSCPYLPDMGKYFPSNRSVFNYGLIKSLNFPVTC